MKTEEDLSQIAPWRLNPILFITGYVALITTIMPIAEYSMGSKVTARLLAFLTVNSLIGWFLGIMALFPPEINAAVRLGRTMAVIAMMLHGLALMFLALCWTPFLWRGLGGRGWTPFM